MAKTAIEKLWRVREIADQAGVAPATIYREIERSALGHVVLGTNTIRVPESELTKWLARCKREAVTA